MNLLVYATSVFLLLVISKVCVNIFRKKNFTTALSIELRVYTTVQFTMLIAGFAAFLALSRLNFFWLNLVLACLLTVNLVIIGWLLEKKYGLQYLEMIRFGLSVAGLLVYCWQVSSIENWVWQFVLSWGGLSLVIMKSLGINQPASAQPQ